ncbi:MAG: PH domain-containing protein [Aquihabitans sp.]
MDASPDSTASVGAPDRQNAGASTAGGPTAGHVPGPPVTSPNGDFEALSPKVLLLWRWAWAGVAASVVVLAVIIGAAAVDLPVAARIAVPVVVATIAMVLVVLVPSAAYARWRYRVTDDGLDIQHGLVVRQESSIPHFRVQHVDIRRGVIQRQLGIVSLTISTASPATDAQLPGLDPEQAETIRRRVLDRAEADDGV